MFAALNFLAALWLLFLFGADASQSTSHSLWFLRIALFFGALVFLFFYYFALVFPFDTKVNVTRQILYSVPLVVIALLSFTSLTVSSVSIESYGAHPQDIGPLYNLSDGVGLLYILAGTIMLLFKFRRSTPREKNQIKLLLFGLSIVAAVNIVTGIVLTVLNVNTRAILFGSFSLFIFSLFVAYAITKHGFFDIRAVVARSAAYLFSLGSIVAVTLLLVYLISVIADNYSLSKGSQQLFDAVVVVALAIGYNPLKSFFDRATTKIFYRDAYDSEGLLNTLNRSLVTTIDLDAILDQSSEVIRDTLKAEFCGFVIKETGSQAYRLAGTRPARIDEGLLKQLTTASEHVKGKVVIAEDLDSSKRHLSGLMHDANVAGLVKLEGRVSGHVQHPGFILLGQKRSGGLYSPQDITVMGIIADELVIAIQNALRFEEIQHFNITLQERIEEATKQLRHANHRLKELDQTKDEFISMASHQLRTPLTTIKGYLSMVLEGDVGPVNKNEKQMIQQAFDSAERMVFLIADLLNVSRLQSGKFVIENKPTDLAKMVESEVKLLTDTAEHHKLKLTLKKPDKFPMLSLDETKIRQVIMNFLDNAIYYTPAEGSIEVELGLTDSAVTYTVTDTGLGVPKAEQHHLFSKFYRAGNARKMRPDGTGLGLFMAKKVIVAQGGSIIFKSEEGKGSTFGFSFPRHKVEIKGKAPVKPAAEAVAA